MKSAIWASIFALSVWIGGANMSYAQQSFSNTATGEPLDVEGTARIGGRNTPAVKSFMKYGIDPYVEVPGCLPLGEQMFLEVCSGCHGRVGEGKVGPALNDNVWIYPKNKTDKGIFETIFGGAKGFMAPHGRDFELDDMLKLIAWVRHIQKDDAKDADWLTPEQKKTYKPFDVGQWKSEGRLAAEKERCAVPKDK
jgi:cytochrome c-L